MDKFFIHSQSTQQKITSIQLSPHLIYNIHRKPHQNIFSNISETNKTGTLLWRSQMYSEPQSNCHPRLLPTFSFVQNKLQNKGYSVPDCYLPASFTVPMFLK